jgi:hypothetical protein
MHMAKFSYDSHGLKTIRFIRKQVHSLTVKSIAQVYSLALNSVIFTH